MQKLFRCLVVAGITAGFASAAQANELTLNMANGRVTLIAKDVPLRQILAEWARVGDTRVVNAEKLTGPPLTLHLVDVSEKEVLDILLRSAAGYMTAPRPDTSPGASLYDRVIILATSRPPATPVNAPPQPFNRPVINQPLPQAMPEPEPDDDDGEPADQGPMPAGTVTPAGPQFPSTPPADGDGEPAQPAMPQQPATSPRPGMLPAPQPPDPNNPYSPVPYTPGTRPGGRGGGPGGA